MLLGYTLQVASLSKGSFSINSCDSFYAPNKRSSSMIYTLYDTHQPLLTMHKMSIQSLITFSSTIHNVW
jgi:hypothetical protein